LPFFEPQLPEDYEKLEGSLVSALRVDALPGPSSEDRYHDQNGQAG